MDYSAAPQGQMNAPRPMPELGRLKAATERVAMAQMKIGNFIERLHGPQGENVGAASPPPEPYRNDLDSLFYQIERLERAANALDAIG